MRPLYALPLALTLGAFAFALPASAQTPMAAPPVPVYTPAPAPLTAPPLSQLTIPVPPAASCGWRWMLARKTSWA